ncbi:Appr-1-p processing [Brachionus plicatilis]|uniref:Appr-1-p processing n=1 Tax=Brachionus plicatilis TaxID=10195 RepID=A0A3M7S8P8_BRAPC|nr:Appr-1-p processing [Brachionus plicatilis]
MDKMNEMNLQSSQLISNVQINSNKKSFYCDLLDQQVNTIVNAANNSLILGGGVAGAILSKCGYKIQEECNGIILKRGDLEVSESVHTSNNGKINANFIIHAVGPRWTDYKDKIECYDDLKATFYNILMYAENKLPSANSIAIPLISSGIFGVPRSLCCKALFFGLEEYLTDSDDSRRKLEIVRLVNIDDETNDELVKFFREKFLKIDCHLELEVKNDEKREIIKTEMIKDLLSCRMCEIELEKNEATKFDCGCYYCVDCRENIEQGNQCKCQN